VDIARIGDSEFEKKFLRFVIGCQEGEAFGLRSVSRRHGWDGPGMGNTRVKDGVNIASS
jgi:hypothetical protein